MCAGRQSCAQRDQSVRRAIMACAPRDLRLQKCASGPGRGPGTTAELMSQWIFFVTSHRPRTPQQGSSVPSGTGVRSLARANAIARRPLGREPPKHCSEETQKANRVKQDGVGVDTILQSLYPISSF